MIQDISGLATGIGSLPFKEAQAAIDLIFRYCPEIPFWPQLPKRDTREGMVAQYIENFPCLRWTPEGVVFNPARKDDELEKFYESIIGNDLEYFRISKEYAQGLHAFYERLGKTDLSRVKYIKCHITGPFTVAASLTDESERALLHDPVFLQVIIKGLAMKALWQIKLFAEFNKKIIVFADEPYLAGFGSAFTPVNREEVVSGLTELMEAIKSENVLTGVHCCGNTDWSMLTEIKAIDIINFDAFDFLDKFTLYADDLKGFLERGGVICWGVAPTREIPETINALALRDRVMQGVELLVKKGVKRELLVNNLLVSPSCGLGTLDTARSEKIFKLLSETSLLLQK